MIEKLVFKLCSAGESHLKFCDSRPGHSIDRPLKQFAIQDVIEFMRSLTELMYFDPNFGDAKNIRVYDTIHLAIMPTIKHDAFYIAIRIADSDMMETLLVGDDKAVECVLIIERLLRETIWRT